MEEPCSFTSTGKPSRHLRARWESPPHTKEEGFGGGNLFLCTVEVEARDFTHLGQVTSLGKTLQESEFIFLLSCSFWALHRRTLLHSVTISEELTVVWVVHGTSPAGTPSSFPMKNEHPAVVQCIPSMAVHDARTHLEAQHSCRGQSCTWAPRKQQA